MFDWDEEVKFFEEIETSRKELDFQFQNNEIGEKKYNKGIVQLSYQLALNGYDDRALDMLTFLYGDYFNNGLAKAEFKVDNQFFERCCFLFDVFNFGNKVPFEVLGNIKLTKE